MVTTQIDGTLNYLNGVLSYIDSVDSYHEKERLKQHAHLPFEKKKEWSSTEKTFRRFLRYKEFYSTPIPIIVCEGKTDYVYLKAAIRQLADQYPRLVEKNQQGNIKLKIKFFRHTGASNRFFSLSRGTGDLGHFIRDYQKEGKDFFQSETQQPVILLIDNDDGATPLKNIMKNMGIITDEISSHVGKNLYVVPTPLLNEKPTMIESFFTDDVLNTKLGGKAFNPSDKGFDNKTEYGKHLFAKEVVKKNEDKIDFAGFKKILDRIDSVITAHKIK
jgi:hypothetical protein